MQCTVLEDLLKLTHLRRARRCRLDGAGGVQIGQPGVSDDGRRSSGDHGPLGVVRGLRKVRGHPLLGGHLCLCFYMQDM